MKNVGGRDVPGHDTWWNSKSISHVYGGHVSPTRRTQRMRGILLWLIGIPIPIIILLYLFNVI